MNVTPSAANIVAVWRAADPADIDAGRGWYRRARAFAAELDPEDPVRAAAVIAVLSPQLSWPRNAQLARTAYALRANGATVDEITAALPMLKRNARKAAAILWGADPDAVVSGPKVRAFWHSIAHPSDARSVVIDRHAFDVAMGRVTPDADAPSRDRFLSRRGGYAIVADCYLRAARILSEESGESISATEVQAVTWTAWRHTRIRAFHGDTERKAV
jgi:hypothetical protein